MLTKKQTPCREYKNVLKMLFVHMMRTCYEYLLSLFEISAYYEDILAIFQVYSTSNVQDICACGIFSEYLWDIIRILFYILLDNFYILRIVLWTFS